jgi:hypothetical protein
MKSVARRVWTGVLMWLDAPVEEQDERGRRQRTTISRDTRQGIPQGSPISPLLSDLYMRRFTRRSDAHPDPSHEKPATADAAAQP